ncbi:MAG: MFS transporter [Anaerolineae bacterium]|nr:MFS transporter [Anaerolineae bacterium]
MNLRLRTLSQFNRETRLLIATSGLMASSFFGIHTLLRVLYVLRLGHGPEYVGLFSAAGAFTYTSMGLPSGALSRRFGVRRIMLAGGLVTIAGMVVLPLTEHLPAQVGEFWPIASQMVLIAGWSMFNVNLVPALMSVTTDRERNHAYAINGVIKGIGTFLGTTIGGVLPGLFASAFALSLDGPRPYGYGIWVSAVVGLAALTPLTRLGTLERPAPFRQAEGLAKFPVLPVALMLAYVYLSHSAWAVCRAFCSAYMDTVLALPASTIGLITSVGQFVSILSPLLAPRLARYRGDGWTLMVVSLGMGISLLPLALAPHWAAVGLGSTGILALAAVRLPALQVFQMELVDTRWRALAYGAASMAMGLSFGSTSLLGGYVIAAMGYRAIFLLGAGLSVAGSGVMWVLCKQQGVLRRAPVPHADA